MRVRDLTPGDVFKDLSGEGEVVYIGRVIPHPYFAETNLWMLIWRMADGEDMMDALSPLQELPITWLRNSREDLKRAIGIK